MSFNSGGESTEQNPTEVIENEVSRNSTDILFDSSEATSYISDAEKMVWTISFGECFY